MAAYRPTVAVHLLWHPGFGPGRDYGAALFCHLFEDPDDLASHGLRIPVRLWRSRSPTSPRWRKPSATWSLCSSTRI